MSHACEKKVMTKSKLKGTLWSFLKCFYERVSVVFVLVHKDARALALGRTDDMTHGPANGFTQVNKETAFYEERNAFIRPQGYTHCTLVS